MEITTLNHNEVEDGDRVVIKITDSDAEDHVVVGYVNGRNGPFLQTTIPYDHNSTRYDLLAVEGSVLSEESENWIDRFNNSRYKLYMEAKVNGSGDISISGT